MFARRVVLVFMIIAAEKVRSKAHVDTIIRLPEGRIQGHTLKSGNNKTFYAFQEIPYAAPPIGENRFKEPKEVIPWKGVLDGTKNRKVCMQNTEIPKNLIMTEDCLYLNIYVPQRHVMKKNLLPVMFYIHGGAFINESGTIEYYNPKFIMDYGIIVVTFNYRLGPLGFLSTRDGVIPGNLGIKDQLKALRWTHKNINFFGGDRKRITVVGASSGAVSAGILQLSPLSRGMVKGFSLMSGSPLIPVCSQYFPDHFAIKLAKVLDTNFTFTSTAKLLEFLQTASARKMIEATVLDDRYNYSLANLVWVPTIENPEYAGAVLNTYMLESLYNGNFERVPTMMSINEEEAIQLITDLNVLKTNAAAVDRNVSLLIDAKLNFPLETYAKAGLEYRSIFTSSTFSDDLKSFVDFMGQDFFTTPITHYAAAVSEYVPVYFYQFSYKGPMGHAISYNIPDENKPGHTEDLRYLFGGLDKITDSAADYPLSDQLTMKRLLTIHTNFVKYQNPPYMNGLIWPPLMKDKLEFLIINTTLSIEVSPKKYSQVRDLFNKYRRPPYVVY